MIRHLRAEWMRKQEKTVRSAEFLDCEDPGSNRTESREKRVGIISKKKRQPMRCRG